MKCNYCNKPAEWVENKEVYGKNYGNSYMIWLCRDCDAYVGCHKNTKEPLGTMADRTLRQMRKTAKNLFITEKLGGNWNCGKRKKQKAYNWLRDLFGKEFHFGSSTVSECEKVITELANQ